MQTENIQNIIFDLGGVIIDLDTHATFQEFQLVNNNSANRNDRVEEHQLFLDYEKGLTNSVAFRDGVRELTNNKKLTDQKIDEIWNRMLLKIPIERLKLIERLRARYQLFILSNTNEIHVEAFNKIVEETTGKPSIDHFFDKVYYSHEVQLRKPEREIYQYVIEDSSLIPQQTLFIDDREENILAARELKLQTFHVTKDRDILSYFAGQ